MLFVTAGVKGGSDRRVIAGVAAVALGVLAASFYIGNYQSREDGFDWELAAIVLTGLGTTALAAATGWLAHSTRIDVRATTDLAQTTREQYAASERPSLLVARPPGYSGPYGSGQLQVVLHNVGLGPAILVRLEGQYEGHEDWQPTIDTARVPVIPPGEQVDAYLPVRFPEPFEPGGPRDAFKVTGSYFDRSMANTYPLRTFE